MPLLMRLLRGCTVQRRAPWVSIIGTLLLASLLGACTTTRLAYNNAPTLSFWWLDSYFDFDAEQSVRLRADLQAAHEWHRSKELPAISAELASLNAKALENTTPQETCKLWNDTRARATTVAERLLPTFAALAPSISEAQLQHIEKEYDKRNRKWRADYLEGSKDQRSDRRFGMFLERTEMFYGRLRPEQRNWLRNQMASSYYDGKLQDKEMVRRQQDALQVLRQLSTSKATPSQAQAALQGVLDRASTAPDAAHREYTARLKAQSCAMVAELHNGMTAQQREKLQTNLQDYADDLRILLVAP